MKKSAAFLLVLAMLGPLGGCGLDLSLSQGPSVKKGHIGDTMATYWFDFTIEDAYSCSEYDGYTAQEGCQLVVATMLVENTWDRSVDLWETDFVILWGDEMENMEITVPVYTEDQFPEEYTLGIDGNRTGLLIYEVPEECRDFAIWFQELYEDEDNPENEDGIEGDSYLVYFTPEKK